MIGLTFSAGVIVFLLTAAVQAQNPDPARLPTTEIIKELTRRADSGDGSPENMMRIQQLLLDLGYSPGVVDGKGGAATESALTDFRLALQAEASNDPYVLQGMFRRCRTVRCSDSVFALWEKAQWASAQLWNDKDAYREYLRLFPKGTSVVAANAAIEELDWLACENKTEPGSCQTYLTRYKSGKHRNRALQTIADEEFTVANQVDTIEAFESFLAKHSGYELATKRLRELRYLKATASGKLTDWVAYLDKSQVSSATLQKWDAAARAAYDQSLKTAREAIERLLFEDVVAQQSLVQAREYLRRFPNGPHQQQVVFLMEPLLFAETVKANTEEAYKKYLESYPTGPNSDASRASLESMMWKRVQREGQRSDYVNYLKSFPNGEHAAEAQAKLEWMKANPAVPKIIHPQTIVGLGSPPRFSWETRFTEESKLAGYSVSGSGWVIDTKGGRWGPNGRSGGRGTLTIPAGGSAKDDHWVRGTNFCGGRLEYSWSGTDTNGNAVSLREVIQLVCKP